MLITLSGGGKSLLAAFASDASGTSIPNNDLTYATKLIWNSIAYDQSGGAIADLVNNRFNIIPGFKYVQIRWQTAFAGNATGYRGCRCKDGGGGSQGGNTRILAADLTQTTNVLVVSRKLVIGVDILQPNNWVAFYPFQNSGAALNANEDVPSSWAEIEFSN